MDKKIAVRLDCYFLAGRLKTEQRMQTQDGRVKTGEESLKTAPGRGRRMDGGDD